MHNPVATTPTSNPLSHRYWCKTLLEILLIMANRYCRRNARFPVHSSPHRKFQKCAARVLIRPGLPHSVTCNRDKSIMLPRNKSEADFFWDLNITFRYFRYFVCLKKSVNINVISFNLKSLRTKVDTKSIVRDYSLIN